MLYVGLLLLVASHLKNTVKSPEEFFTKAPRSWMHQGALGGLGEALGEAYFWVPLWNFHVYIYIYLFKGWQCGGFTIHPNKPDLNGETIFLYLLYIYTNTCIYIYISIFDSIWMNSKATFLDGRGPPWNPLPLVGYENIGGLVKT